MVIYAKITLESIISLLFAVTFHNSCWDLSRDTDAKVQTGDTIPCFNSSCSPPCVSYGMNTVNYILWGYLFLNRYFISKFLRCMFFLYKPKQRVFLLQRCGCLSNEVMSLTDFSHITTGLCLSTCGSTSNMALNWVSDLSGRVVQRDRASDLVWNLPFPIILSADLCA